MNGQYLRNGSQIQIWWTALMNFLLRSITITHPCSGITKIIQGIKHHIYLLLCEPKASMFTHGLDDEAWLALCPPTAVMMKLDWLYVHPRPWWWSLIGSMSTHGLDDEAWLALCPPMALMMKLDHLWSIQGRICAYFMCSNAIKT